MKRGQPLQRKTPLRSRSPRRAVQERAYRQLRRDFLAEHNRCEMCGRPSQEVHHKRGRVGALFLAVEHWVALCSADHKFLTEHPAEAYALGLSERRVS